MTQVATRARSKRSAAVAAIAADRCGAPGYDRRLSDKILAAFNHAYATGALRTAHHLKSVLAEVEHHECATHDRRNIGAVNQAELWVAFVEARNRYNELSSRKDAAPAKLDAAIEVMKDAYRAWSDAV